MRLRLCTWNINSVRLRLDLVRRMVETLAPDVVCLQETKVADELFPLLDCQSWGYPHVAISGMKAYNGLAILSKFPLDDVRTPHWCGRQDCRHLIARVQGIELHNLYVPAGGDIPDPEANPKFAHKLEFLDAVADWFVETPPPARAVLVGDLNVAPLETDVWSHKQMLKVVSHTPVEVERLARLAESGRWVDAVRRVIPPAEKLYTWWSYRAQDWKKNDRGRRLDHVWVTPELAGAVAWAQVAKETRDWQPPSDHVPVVVDLDI